MAKPSDAKGLRSSALHIFFVAVSGSVHHCTRVTAYAASLWRAAKIAGLAANRYHRPTKQVFQFARYEAREEAVHRLGCEAPGDAPNSEVSDMVCGAYRVSTRAFQRRRLRLFPQIVR